MARPVAGEILELALEADAPEGHGDVEEDAALGKKSLEVAILDEGYHEEEKADGEEEEAGEGIGDLDEQLVVRGRALQLAGGFRAVREHRDLVQPEHHEGPAGDGDGRVDHTDRGESGGGRRRRRGSHGDEEERENYGSRGDIGDGWGKEIMIILISELCLLFLVD